MDHRGAKACEKLAPDGAAWLPWRPKLQPQGLPSIIDEAATRLSFTVETTVLPSFARQRDSKTLGGFIVLA